jgi:hypothetical protein
VQDPLFAAEKRFREHQIHLEVNMPTGILDFVAFSWAETYLFTSSS